MSYARFGEDGSDVYVFCGGGYLECCACVLRLSHRQGPVQFVGDAGKACDDMLVHLDAHREQGHVVPERAFEALRDPAEREQIARVFAEAAR